jgi:hypothetical protein
MPAPAGHGEAIEELGLAKLGAEKALRSGKEKSKNRETINWDRRTEEDTNENTCCCSATC